jgi:hypothetical protein
VKINIEKMHDWLTGWEMPSVISGCWSSSNVVSFSVLLETLVCPSPFGTWRTTTSGRCCCSGSTCGELVILYFDGESSLWYFRCFIVSTVLARWRQLWWWWWWCLCLEFRFNDAFSTIDESFDDFSVGFILFCSFIEEDA